MFGQFAYCNAPAFFAAANAAIANGKLKVPAAGTASDGKPCPPLGNPSDNRLTDAFVDPAMGCKPRTAPDLADPGSLVPALALNELQARMTQPAPVAIVPGGDPMTLVNGNLSLTKTNLYRQGAE